jgi:hypothetical protein
MNKQNRRLIGLARVGAPIVQLAVPTVDIVAINIIGPPPEI